MTGTLLSLGHGYSARALGARLIADGWRVLGTTRNPATARALRAAGVEPVLWPDEVAAAIGAATHLLTSIAPDAAGDPVLRAFGPALGAHRWAWVGYLSTTGVYGDRQGGWVDETTPPAAGRGRSQARVQAEAAWLATGMPVHVFRLAGIYGPGRSALDRLRDGTARRIVKPGQIFSRIHVEDIARVLRASIDRPNPGAIYNVCDDEPAPAEDVIAHAAALLGLPPPPAVPWDQADLSPMARSFYQESRRVRNDRIRRELGVTLAYPSYRQGLAAILAQENPAAAG